MEIIRFAMQMEIDGQRFYEKAAADSPLKELKEIFMYLAEEEKRHFKFFKSLADGESDKAAKELSGGSMEKSKNIFLKMLESGETKNFGDQVKQAWKKALEIEEQAVKLYTEEAKRESDAKRQELLNKIAAEERNHVYLVTNILSYIQDPETFAESQRFAAFKSWEGH
jgi:rubrerythrin